MVVATKEPERLRGGGGGGSRTRTSSWWWWLRTKWIDHERGNGMARMREEWRERERNARMREELRRTERLRDESSRETENVRKMKVRTKRAKTV